MDNGWIKIHRKILEWEWYKDVNTYKLFTHFLLLANHKPRKWMGQTINEGQLITGLFSLEADTGLSIQNIRTSIKRLKSTNEITIKSTNRFSIITLIKYSDYQGKTDNLTNEITNNLTNNQQTTNNKQELKNDKKNTLEETSSSGEIVSIIKAFESINPASKRFYSNTTQRSACADLIKTYTFDRVMTVIANTLPKTNKIKYMPNIRSPLQLFEKWSTLEDEIYKLKNKGPEVKNKVAF